MCKLLIIFRILWSLPCTVVFNFRYLPFKQAYKLPILLMNVRLKKMSGRVMLSNDKIKPGMVRLGQRIISVYENTKGRTIWENRGEIVFGSNVIIGHNSAISTGINGRIVFGDNIVASSNMRIISYERITIGSNTRISWENIITDTDFHETINVESGKRSEASKEVLIGRNNWIGIRSLVLKGTRTPDYCIIGANSLTNKPYDVPSYSILAGSPVRLVKTGVYRDLNSFVE